MSAAAVNPKRVRCLKEGGPGPVAYWMSRDQRSRDNWALLYAQELARAWKAPLAVVFCLVPRFLDARARQYAFMLKGLKEVEASLADKGIPFFLLQGSPEEEIPRFVNQSGVRALVADFDPLRIKRRWRDEVAERAGTAFFEVDAHNVVPCWIASDKKEYGAYTIRPKLERLLPGFLEEFPPLQDHPFPWPREVPAVDWKETGRVLRADASVREVSWIKPGMSAGIRTLNDFIENRLADFDRYRNDPNADAQSNLSPYLHFGQVSAQRVALEVRNSPAFQPGAFLEELVVRRELADNFCFYEPGYDSVDGFPDWAKKTLTVHRADPRPYLYTPAQFEHARTHDALWNAAQNQMILRGKMHGYMRMYWAKKILEWSESPQEALCTALYLNDSYELDGRDPCGYTGIAWSIGGVHDRAWGERPVSGKIRYMSPAGCRRKFDVDAYIMTWQGSS